MTEPTTATTEQQPPATDGQQPNAQSQTPGDATGTNGGQQSEEKQFSQSQLDAIVKDRLERAQKAAETKAAKAAEDAKAEELAKQQKFQELSEELAVKVKDLEPQVETLTAERDQLREIVGTIITAETKDWPKEVLELLPADEADVLTRYAAVARTRPLAAKLSQATPPAGNSPNPKPNGAAGNAQEGRERVAAFYRGRI